MHHDVYLATVHKLDPEQPHIRLTDVEPPPHNDAVHSAPLHLYARWGRRKKIARRADGIRSLRAHLFAVPEVAVVASTLMREAPLLNRGTARYRRRREDTRACQGRSGRVCPIGVLRLYHVHLKEASVAVGNAVRTRVLHCCLPKGEERP